MTDVSRDQLRDEAHEVLLWRAAFLRTVKYFVVDDDRAEVARLARMMAARSRC